MTTKKRNYLIFTLFLIMFTLAVSFSLRGLFIPTFKKEFNVNDKHIGIFLAIMEITAMISYIIGNKIVEKIGQKRLLQIGILTCAISFYLITLSWNFIIFIIIYIFITLGYNFLLFGLNTTVPLINISFQALLMNSLHGFFGVGNTISQRVVGYLLALNFNWQSIFHYISLAFVIVLFLYSFSENLKDDYSDKTIDRSIKNKKLLILFTIAIGLYVSAEIQTGNWFMNLLTNHYNLGPNIATKYTFVFFATFTLGRFLGGFVTEKLGYFKSIHYSLLLSIATYLLGLLFKINGLYLIASSGLFLAIIYPTTIVVVSRNFKHNSSRAIALISMFVSLFVLATGLIIGFLNDLIGPYYSFFTIPITLMGSIIIYYYLNLEVEKNNS